MANYIVGTFLVVVGIICLLMMLAGMIFIPDGQKPRPTWWLLVMAALFFLFGYLCFADQAHVAHAHLAIVLLPIHLQRARSCGLDYQTDQVPRWITPGMCRAFLSHDDDGTPVVTFEGTRPNFASDWKVDFNQVPLDLDPSLGRLPDGFGRAVHSVIFRIMREIDLALPVDFNGHSMGASNALIAAATWKVSGRKLGRVSAFEAARVGKLGNQLRGEDVLITTHGTDPVPSQPFWYDHPVEPIHLNAPASMLLEPVDCHEIDTVVAAIDAALQATGTS